VLLQLKLVHLVCQHLLRQLKQILNSPILRQLNFKTINSMSGLATKNHFSQALKRMLKTKKLMLFLRK
jgi:hypothetical protein